MSQSRAYRCPVDGQRYAVVHALTALDAAAFFKAAFPDKAVITQCVPWEDGRFEPGHVDVRARAFNMCLRRAE